MFKNSYSIQSIFDCKACKEMVLYERNQLLNEQTKTSMNQVINERHSLYLRFPKKLNSDRTLAETEVRALNPKIIRVRIPRQKSANYCMIDFDTKVDKEKALKQIKKIQINDKNLVVKDAIRSDKTKVEKKIEKVEVKREVSDALRHLVGEIKKSLDKDYSKRNITNGVIIKDLKTGTTQADVRQLFPQAIDVKMNMKAERKNSFALFWMATPKDAKQAATKAVKINGEEYVVSLQKDKKSQKTSRKSQATSKTSNGENTNESGNESTSEDSDVDEDENEDMNENHASEDESD